MKQKSVSDWMKEQLASRPGVGSKSTKGNATKNSNRPGRLEEPVFAFTRNGRREVPIGTEYCIFRKIDGKGRKIAVSFFFTDAVLNVREDDHAVYTPHSEAIGTH